MKKALWIGLALVACAEEVPGFAPPSGQLYFPLGMAIAAGTSAQPWLLVGNTNFDQRYNAGFVSTLDLVKLGTLATMPPEGGNTVNVIASFSKGTVDAYVGQTKVLQLGGPILHVPSAQSGLPSDRVFVSARGLNRVTMLSLDPAGKLSCNGKGEAVEATDCSANWVLPTDVDDPYALAYVPVPGSAGVVAVSYLTGPLTADPVTSGVSAIDLDGFEARTNSDTSPAPVPMKTTVFSEFGGMSGLSVAPGSGGQAARLFGSPIVPGSSLPITTFVVVEREGGPVIERASGTDLSGAASIVEVRGIAATSARVFASVRFYESSTAYNAGVAVLDISGPSAVLLTVVEVGNELGQPVLDPRGRFLYVPDIRDDSIYVLDVGADQPEIVAAIRGRMLRIVDGAQVPARILASPTDLVFDTRNGKTLLYVTNFANSTLGVIDATDPDPRRHKVIARLGRDIDANGDVEGEE